MTAQNQQQELLAAIGQKLRSTREAQGLTLQDVSSRTRIQNSFLEKIEQGQLEGLPGFSFVRGFIHNYAQMLGVDDPELLEQLQAMGRAADAMPQPPMRPVTERLLDAEKAKGLPWPRLALLALLAILVLWVGYLLVRVFLPSDAAYEPPPAKAPVAQNPVAQAPVAQAPVVQAPLALAPVAQAPAAQAPSPAFSPRAPAPKSSAPVAGGTAATAAGPAARPGMGPNALRVTVRGLEDTWVRYSLDRKPPLEVLMRPAESASFDADDEIRLTIGKSQGVSVYLNGEEVVLPTAQNRLVADLVLNKLTVLKMRN
jgi:cytoskeleton protein RodZ